MKLPKKNSLEHGFTLIEVLVVIGILAILLGIVLVAVNPGKNSQDARNTKRQSDILNILNAVNQYDVAVGNFPSGTPAGGAAAVTITSGTGGTLAAFCNALVPTYIAALPFDPSASGAHFTSCSDYNSGYTISQSSAGSRITISAPSAEGGASLSVTR